MRHGDSDRVSDHFAAHARDWTPASVRHATRLLYAPVSPDPAIAGHCALVLSEGERHRAHRFVTEESRAHFQQRRAFRRYCGAALLGSSRPLSGIDFKVTDQGRPYLPQKPDAWFSFSSCRFGFLAAWSATHDVGVDIEDQTRRLEAVELAQRYFSQAEARTVEGLAGEARTRTFLQLWTLKEAALKCIGEGLPYGLDAFAFELSSDPRVVKAPNDRGGAQRYRAHLIEGPDSCAALVCAERAQA